MNLDQELTLCSAAGGLVGTISRGQWAELLGAKKASDVRFALGRLRMKLGRQVKVEEVAKELGHKLQAEAGAPAPLPPPRAPEPEPELEPEISAAAADEPEDDDEQLDDVDDQVDEDEADDATPPELEAETQTEEAEAPQAVASPILQPAAAAAKCKPAPPAAPVPAAAAVRGAIDYLEVLRRLGVASLPEWARAAGVQVPSARKFMVRSRHLLEVIDGWPSRYRVRAGGAAAIAEPAAKPAPAPRAPKPAAKPVAEAAAASAPEASPAAPRRSPSQPRAAFALTTKQLDGDLLPLLEQLVERYCDHHDFTFLPAARRRLQSTLKRLGI